MCVLDWQIPVLEPASAFNEIVKEGRCKSPDVANLHAGMLQGWTAVFEKIGYDERTTYHSNSSNRLRAIMNGELIMARPIQLPFSHKKTLDRPLCASMA